MLFDGLKITKFCEISTVDLSYVVPVKSTVEISKNFVAFSEYMNFIYIFKGLHLLFVPNGPGAPLIPEATFIPDSRVVERAREKTRDVKNTDKEKIGFYFQKDRN
jgi:hypothetical protein